MVDTQPKVAVVPTRKRVNADIVDGAAPETPALKKKNQFTSTSSTCCCITTDNEVCIPTEAEREDHTCYSSWKDKANLQ